jgi:hypothetical protein
MSKETELDLLNEKRVARAVENHFGWTLEKITEKYHPLDYVLVKDRREVGAILCGYSEIKCRKIPSTKYDSGIVDLKKWQNIKLMLQTALLPVYLIYAWSDVIGIKLCRLEDNYRVLMIGSVESYQPHVLVPVAEFTKLDL